jgi:hypothetical protein
MEVSLYKVHLKSKNIAQSISFHSFLFDTDIEEEEAGESYIKVGLTRFYFDESIKKALTKPVFTIGFADTSDFENFKNKVNLAFYKENLTPHIILNTDFIFSYKDVDGNSWRFELM